MRPAFAPRQSWAESACGGDKSHALHGANLCVDVITRSTQTSLIPNTVLSEISARDICEPPPLWRRAPLCPLSVPMRDRQSPTAGAAFSGLPARPLEDLGHVRDRLRSTQSPPGWARPRRSRLVLRPDPPTSGPCDGDDDRAPCSGWTAPRKVARSLS